jgi:ATP-dependent RNA helicase DDX24/MAK5
VFHDRPCGALAAIQLQHLSRPLLVNSVQGSGKTLAFALPIINLLVNDAAMRADAARAGSSDDGDVAAADDAVPSTSESTLARRDARLRALVLTPTRELANQVHAHLSAVGKAVGVSSATITGGMSRQKQERVLRGAPDVVVATPGRLWDLISSGAPHVGDLSGLACLVIDEADRMVAVGHFQEVAAILSKVPAYAQRLASTTTTTAEASGAKQEDGSEVEEGGDEAAAAALPTRKLRTYVFSATLTLPSAMKAKLARSRTASRGSDGAATFEALVDMIPFRGKPKVRGQRGASSDREGLGAAVDQLV